MPNINGHALLALASLCTRSGQPAAYVTSQHQVQLLVHVGDRNLRDKLDGFPLRDAEFVDQGVRVLIDKDRFFVHGEEVVNGYLCRQLRHALLGELQD